MNEKEIARNGAAANRTPRSLERLSWFGSACLAAIALAGCPSTATTSSTAIVTGVEILASTVVAGHGCGKDTPTEVYRYAVVVYHAKLSDGSVQMAIEDGPAVASNIFECYADGLFSNLPPSADGSANYIVRVYAYSYASFQKNPAVGALECAPATRPPCPAEDPSAVTLAAVAGAADFTLNCTAKEEQGVPVLARCVDEPVDGAGNDASADGSDEAATSEAATADAGRRDL